MLHAPTMSTTSGNPNKAVKKYLILWFFFLIFLFYFIKSREPVEKLLQRKEKNFNRFANTNTSQNRNKPAGHLKLEQLNSILQEYPHLTRPIIHIKLTDADF